MTLKVRFAFLAVLLVSLATTALPQSERKTTAGAGPGGLAQVTFLAHRLGTDHAEGVTTLDMNGDGYLDILSGAYWYENPGPQRRRLEAASIPRSRHTGRVCCRLRRMDHRRKS